MEHRIKPVAHIRSDFSEKFGIPRQSGLVPELRAEIVFEKEYRNPDFLRGIESFSHLWLIWQFSASLAHSASPTVRPPRLGGNTRVGVFATRSPFRPNSLGLSSVKLVEVKKTNEGSVLIVSGADLMDGTPIFDIKPYLPYADSHPEANGSFSDTFSDYRLLVHFPEEMIARIPPEKREALVGILAGDPRPSYQNDPERIYGMNFAGKTVRFRVKDDEVVVLSVE